MPSWTTRMVGMVLAILICCTPEMLTAAAQTVADQAQTSSSSSTPQAGATDQQDAAGAGQSAAPDANDAQQPLPNAPSSNSAAGQTPNQDQNSTQNQNPTDQNKTNAQQPQQQPAEPAGTAAAQIGKLKGGPASKPAGAAIAPAKQRRVRSFLIKFGALAAAGAAAGTVYALSRSSPTRPPGAR